MNSVFLRHLSSFLYFLLLLCLGFFLASCKPNSAHSLADRVNQIQQEEVEEMPEDEFNSADPEKESLSVAELTNQELKAEKDVLEIKTSTGAEGLVKEEEKTPSLITVEKAEPEKTVGPVVTQTPLQEVKTAETPKEESGKIIYHKGFQAYSKEAFQQALAANETIFVDVFASWCPTCQANKPKLASAVNTLNSSGGDLVVFQVNYDEDRDFLKEYGIPRQSTYLVFKEGKELKRTSGLMTEKAFEALVAQ